MRSLAPLLAAVLLSLSCDGDAESQALQEPQATAGRDPADPAATPPESRKKPPPLDLAAWLNAQPTSLDELKGKVVVLDFWGTRHGRCRRLMPRLQALYEKHKEHGLVVVGITEDPRAEAEAFAKTHHITYPLACDRMADGFGRTFDAYAVATVPTTWVIDRQGGVAWRGPGHELREELVLAELKREERGER
ncbi:MAG: peroxiredoxin family protein [Candidatus Brocadiia bacterium]